MSKSSESLMRMRRPPGRCRRTTVTFRKLAVPDLTTTVLPLTLTGFAADIAGGSARMRQSSMRIFTIAAMLLGAFVGALLEKSSITLPLLIAAGAGAVSFGVYAWSAGRTKEHLF